MDVVLWQEGEVKVEIKAGEVVISYGGKGAKGAVHLELEYFFTKLAEAIPGQIDDAVIKLIIGALK